MALVSFLLGAFVRWLNLETEKMNLQTLSQKRKSFAHDLLTGDEPMLMRLLPPIIPFYIALFIFMNLGYVRETYIGLTASILYLYNFVPKAKSPASPRPGIIYPFSFNLSSLVAIHK